MKLYPCARVLLWVVGFVSAILPTVAATSPDGTGASKTTVFGTSNGYDVGGTDPLCWSSSLDANAKSQTGKGNEVEQLNELLYGESNTTDASVGRLLPDCYSGGVQMSLEPVTSSLRQMYIGEDFTFELSLEVDLGHLPLHNTSNVGAKSTIHVRLQLCDALKQGFCNPIRDSRAEDAALTRNETDLLPSNATGALEFPEGENKWAYKEGDVLYGIPDGNLVAARWCKWTLRAVETDDVDSMLYRTAVNITLRLPDAGMREGAYFFIGHAVLNFETEEDLERIDIAQAIPGNVVEVLFPPTILRVSQGTRVGLLLVIAVSGGAALFMFGATVYYRSHAVMKIAQGSLLAAMTLMSFLLIVLTYTAIPDNLVFCTINGSALLIPLTTLGAILVGRIWRVYSTLSNVNRLGRHESEPNSLSFQFGDFMMNILDLMATIPSYCRRGVPRRQSTFNGLRRTVTMAQTISVICCMSLPQILYQIISLAQQNRSVIIEFTEQGDIGREVCSQRWAQGSGFLLMLGVYAVAIWLTWRSRNLPSAFQEKEQITIAATSCAVLGCVTLSLMGIVNVPTTHPDVQVSTCSRVPDHCLLTCTSGYLGCLLVNWVCG